MNTASDTPPPSGRPGWSARAFPESDRDQSHGDAIQPWLRSRTRLSVPTAFIPVPLGVLADRISVPSLHSGAITVRRPLAWPMPSSAARMTACCTGVQLLLAHNAPEPHPLAPSTPRLRREATASPSSWYPSEAAKSRHGKAARLRPAVSWMSSQQFLLVADPENRLRSASPRPRANSHRSPFAARTVDQRYRLVLSGQKALAVLVVCQQSPQAPTRRCQIRCRTGAFSPSPAC